jgi:hypothetical protein
MNEWEAETLLVSQLSGAANRVMRQVRLGLNRTDVLVAWSDDLHGGLEAIEVKLDDWRRGSHQAYLSANYAHAASIAMPRPSASRVDLSYLKGLGVGLIAFDETGWDRILAPRERPLPPAVLAAIRERMLGIQA